MASRVFILFGKTCSERSRWNFATTITTTTVLILPLILLLGLFSVFLTGLCFRNYWVPKNNVGGVVEAWLLQLSCLFCHLANGIKNQNTGGTTDYRLQTIECVQLPCLLLALCVCVCGLWWWRCRWHYRLSDVTVDADAAAFCRCLHGRQASSGQSLSLSFQSFLKNFHSPFVFNWLFLSNFIVKVWNLLKRDLGLQSLDLTVNIFLMKLFRTNDMSVVNYNQIVSWCFRFTYLALLPEEDLENLKLHIWWCY